MKKVWTEAIKHSNRIRWRCWEGHAVRYEDGNWRFVAVAFADTRKKSIDAVTVAAKSLGYTVSGYSIRGFE